VLKFHQNAKEQCGAATKLFFWGEIFENHSPKFKVFGLGLPHLECLLLQIAKQQADYKPFFFNYPTYPVARPGLSRFSCGWLPVWWLHHKSGKTNLEFWCPSFKDECEQYPMAPYLLCFALIR